MATHRYRSRDITSEEILFIRQLIADRPELSRWKLSRELCEAWQWKQANGALRDMVCRGLLLMLHRAGEIELPPVKRVGTESNRGAAKARARDPRQPSSARTTGEHHSAGVYTSAAHAGRGVVQQPDGAVSLSGLRTTHRRAPEVSGESRAAK